MKYKITHNTTYSYGETVPMCQNVVHLTPRSGPRQSCRFHRLAIKPTPSSIGRRVDYFGNPMNYFTITDGHRRLSVTAISKVSLEPVELIDPSQTDPWEAVRDALAADLSTDGLAAYQFAFDSPMVARGETLMQYASESFAPGRPVLEAAFELTQRIHTDFTYDPTATTVFTPVEEVMANRRGVCQDLAHVEIGCLRSLGLAARYVSGYLRTEPAPGQPRLVGADASHAWLSIYCGRHGWIDADPTNNVLPTTDHITVAWGRDYGDVCPITGMFVGGGQHTLNVSVNVAPLEEAG